MHFANTENRKDQGKNFQVTYKNIWNFCFNYWLQKPVLIVFIVVCMIVGVGFNAIQPIFAGRIIDSMISGGENAVAATYQNLFIFIGFGLAFAVFRTVSIYVWNWYSVWMHKNVAVDALRRVQRFSADWHVNSFAGGTVRKINRGTTSFDTAGTNFIEGLLPSIAAMTAMTGILIWHLPPIGFFAAFMIVVYTSVSIWMSVKIMRPKFTAMAQADTKVGGHLADVITGNPTVKAFGAETREDQTFAGVTENWRKKSTHAWQWAQTGDLIRTTLRVSMMGGMVALAIHLWTNGQATPGDIGVAISSFFVLAGYIRNIGMYIGMAQRSFSDMEDIVEFWLGKDDVVDAPGAAPLVMDPRPENRGRITFDSVGFSYQRDGLHRKIYDDFSLTIQPGERVALVGPSGSGKSTFVKLVQRLYDIQQGEIRIDGQNIAKVTQQSLRQAIAVVPQDPIMFHRSLSQNITYGKPDASMDEIIAAAKKAFAHEFIEKLPHGYDTLVGERGIKLSGGERQRVAIARAILADAPILILDEATSSLDSVSEFYIQKALEGLMKGRTTITIAHRLSTIRSVDRILVFRDGAIVEEGRHAALLSTPNSVYKELYEMQALGFLDELDTKTGS